MHTTYVIRGIKIGFTLFILSEIMFFFSFFWAFFHRALAPTSEIGMTWPPTGIAPIHP
ncbi:cytochrome c oxidase subunit 3 [Klebsiella pneumoniae]|uniref:cytochrome c oxidase subunit 3 n=1 Tax=Klebsiella pneumoniae TaxID=573 RepID=UPI0034D2647B